MPPWHANPHYGTFVGDRSLSTEEARTLVHRIEAGTPRGPGADPLATRPTTWLEWSLGKPDLIMEVPAFQVPATGVVNYQYPPAANPDANRVVHWGKQTWDEMNVGWIRYRYADEGAGEAKTARTSEGDAR
jgi:hypothetical protein